MYKAAITFLLATICFLMPVLGASSSRVCIDNETLQTNTSYDVLNNGNTTTLVISKTEPCPNGCMNILNTCTPNIFIQILEMSGVTILFFGMMILGSQLSVNLPFIDVIMNTVLIIFSAIIAVTDIFGSFSGLFYAEAVIFFGIGIVFLYNNVWGGG